MKSVLGVVCAVAVGVLGACGGSDSGGGGGGCSPGNSASMTLSSTGVSPKAVCVVPGGRVNFNNTDQNPHTLASDGCPELNVGPIAGSGGTRAVVFPNAETCTFHEAANPADAAFQGTVAVSQASVQGPGY